MTRCRELLAVSVCAFACLAMPGPVNGQYRPPEPLPAPVPPAQPLSTPTPPPGGLAPATPGRDSTKRRIGWSWEPVLVLDAGWEQNVGFTRAPSSDDMFGSAAGCLIRVRRGSRSDFSLTVSGVARARTARAGQPWRLAERNALTLDGSWIATDFESGPYLDTIYWSGELSLAHRVAPRDEVPLFSTDGGRPLDPPGSDGLVRIGAHLRLVPAPGPGGRSRKRGHLRDRNGPARGSLLPKARIPTGRRLEFLANGSFVLLKDDTAPDDRRSGDAYLGASSRLKDWLRLVVGYPFRIRDEYLGGLRNDRATVSVVFRESAL